MQSDYLTIFRAISSHSQDHFNSVESIESWLITLYKVSWEKNNCSKCVLAWGYQWYVITLPALIGEHSCGGWSCPLIYILECLYSNLYKFSLSLCPSTWWGIIVFKALNLLKPCSFTCGISVLAAFLVPVMFDFTFSYVLGILHSRP